MLRILISFIFFFVFTLNVNAENRPLAQEQAFNFSAYLDKQNQLILEWHIAPGYFLYRDKLKLNLQSESQIKIDNIDLPKGEPWRDEVHGEYQIYKGIIKVPVVLMRPIKGFLDLQIGYQGCSSKGFCYPPVKKYLQVGLSDQQGPLDLTKNVVAKNQPKPMVLSGENYTDKLLNGGNRFVLILGFFGLGLLLAFTPCVLPMVPILSSIIVGHHKKTTANSFLLSFVYVLGMALTYAIAGIAVAMLGNSIQSAMQKPWVIVFFSLLIVGLAFWLLDFYKMHLPAHWQRNITHWSHQQKSGTYLGVFFMGVLSTLIVSPCVSAPLVGVLAYIAQSGDAVLGGSALLAMGFGMGVPLLMIGLSARKILPKSGAWMNTIQQVVAIFMLGMAIWMLSRVINASVALFLWGVLLAFVAYLLGFFTKLKGESRNLQRGLGLITLTYATILMIGAVMGNSDPLNPWENWRITSEKKIPFLVLNNLDQLNQQLKIGKENKKVVMLDFYADWCSSCVVMDKHVFSNSEVKNKLENVILLRVDMTKNSDFDRVMLKRFQVIAPPTIVFFDPEGTELQHLKIVGEVNAQEFLAHLQQVQN